MVHDNKLSPLRCITSILWTEGTVVGAVATLLAEVDISSDAALQQRLGRPSVVAHAHEDLVGLVLAEEAQGVHLWRRSGVAKDNRWRVTSLYSSLAV